MADTVDENEESARPIDEIVEELKRAIKNSSEYREFQQTGRELDKTPDLRRQVDAARRELFRAQNSDDGDSPEKINQKYEDLFALRPAARYRNAEVRLSRLIQQVCRDLVRDLNFDTSFLEQ
ncbi:MAG: YlbF family regulator [Lachnospira sp.]|nr:YlbF family regulator [Lachnospira sp.]